MNTYRDNNNTILEINLAGHNPKDVEITASRDKLTVESVRKAREWKLALKSMLSDSVGYFPDKDELVKHSWELIDADCDKITSNWDNGLLLITIPPKEEECRKIKIS